MGNTIVKNMKSNETVKSLPTILCVDDEKIILECLKIQIQNFFEGRCHVVLAESGEEALEIIDEMRSDEMMHPHLIISDQIMPGMRGDQFLTQVHSKYPDIVKVMLTGMSQDEDIERAYELANLRKVILKPWSGEELLETIKYGLSEYQTIIENRKADGRASA